MLSLEIGARIGEGENKKKKNDTSFDDLRDTFRELCKVFEDTKNYMVKYADVKEDNRAFDDRVNELKRNNYRETTESLRRELDMLT